MKKSWVFFTAAMLALVCSSCRNSHGLYPVSGKVMYKGEPAAGAFVHFRRANADPVNDQSVMGVVKEDGSFMIYSGEHPGAAPGEYAVLIQWRQGSREPKAGANRQLPTDRLQGRYADPAQPLWHVVLRAETNRLPPFDLTD
jgi:hypothetical protein